MPLALLALALVAVEPVNVARARVGAQSVARDPRLQALAEARARVAEATTSTDQLRHADEQDAAAHGWETIRPGPPGCRDDWDKNWTEIGPTPIRPDVLLKWLSGPTVWDSPGVMEPHQYDFRVKGWNRYGLARVGRYTVLILGAE